MQLIFYTNVSPEEYHRQGKDFPFPEPDHCPHCQLEIPPQKHGFYERNAIDAISAAASSSGVITANTATLPFPTCFFLPALFPVHYRFNLYRHPPVLDFNFSLRAALSS